MGYYLRPVKEHFCSTNSGYCSVCVSHALNPDNIVRDTMPAVGKFWIGLGVLLITVWVVASVQGCTLVPQKDTNLYEIHHEYCVQQKIAQAGPSGYPGALLNAAHDACYREESAH